MKNMNNKRSTKILTLAIILFTCSAQVFVEKPKKEVYIPMDYSTCGYHASELAIPDVRKRRNGNSEKLWQFACR